MNKEFSNFLESNHDAAKEIVTHLKSKFEYVSILGTHCDGKTINVSDKGVSVVDNSFNEQGFVVRVFKDGLYSEYSFSTLTDAKKISAEIVKSANVKENIEKSIYVKASNNPLYEEEQLTKSYSKMDKYEDVELEDIIKKCKNIINKSMEENEYIISGKCRVEYQKVSKMFISSNKDLKQVYPWATASYTCILNRNRLSKFNRGSASGVSLSNVLTNLEKQVKNINNDALELLDSDHIEPGTYDCITTPEISGLIAHEAFGHGVEMDMFVKNRALGKQYVGKRVGSDLVEMHEGAIPYDDVSSYFFDDEGTLAHDTIEIKDGILLTGVADAISAAKLNIAPTGNGKRESYKRKAYSRMTSTYFIPRTSSLDDMIKSINYGFLIDGEVSGMEDPKNWGIQCVALIGKEIRNGKFTGRIVSPLIMTGNVLDLLNSVSMVSKDFGLYGSGACGKGYKEFVKTAIGGPYMKVKVKLG